MKNLNEVSKAENCKESKCAIGYFRGYLKDEEFKKVANELLKILENNKYVKQINDVSKMKVLPMQTQKWLNEVWFPKAAQLGLKYFAFIRSLDKFGKLSTEFANKEAESAKNPFGIEIRYFDEMLFAKVWLNSKG